MSKDPAFVAVEPVPERLSNPIIRYFLATRPAFLLASLMPCLIGVAAAAADGVSVDIYNALLTVLGALLFHAAANVLNDYYDSLNGTDEHNTRRLYPFTGGSRFIQNGVLSRKETARFGFSLFVMGSCIGLVLLMQSGPGLLLIGLSGGLIVWAYSAPPLYLNSRGLGELSIAVAFGVLVVVGADYVQRGSFSVFPLLLAIPYGLLASVLLYINQFPDREADELAGKHHLVVRLGPQRARWGYLLLVLGANFYLPALVLVSDVTPWVLLALLASPMNMVAAAQLLRYAQEPASLVPAIRLTILALLVHGLLLTLGLMVGA